MPLDKNRAKQIMDKYQLDVLVATSPENNIYLSDVFSPTQQYLKDISFFSILTYDGDVAVVMPMSDIDTFVYKNPQIKDIRVYGKFYYVARESQHVSIIEKRFIEILKGIKRGKTAEDVLLGVLKEKALMLGT